MKSTSSLPQLFGKWSWVVCAVFAFLLTRTATAAPQLVIEQPAGTPKNRGGIVAWGSNSSGETTVPSGLTEVTAIAAGGTHTVALKSNGTVVAWGDNTTGQRNVPAGLTGVTAIAAGFYHTVALKSNGTVVAWGPNAACQSRHHGTKELTPCCSHRHICFHEPLLQRLILQLNLMFKRVRCRKQTCVEAYDVLVCFHSWPWSVCSA